jgi:hemerythrin
MNAQWTAIACPDAHIDALRKDLLRGADAVVLAAARAAPPAELARLAQALLETARAEFEAEERRLRAARSLTLVRHATEHERFLSDLAALAATAARGNAVAVRALRPERWIPEWLSAHAGTDRDLAS